MSEFANQYLQLLRRQVDEEIDYLLSNKHNSEQNYVPCMFCVQHKENYYRCNRLHDLRMFQSSIVSNQSGKLTAPISRQRIGFDILSDELKLPAKSHMEFPLLYPKI